MLSVTLAYWLALSSGTGTVAGPVKSLVRRMGGNRARVSVTSRPTSIAVGAIARATEKRRGLQQRLQLLRLQQAFQKLQCLEDY
jgi:hypothetical protein